MNIKITVFSTIILFSYTMNAAISIPPNTEKKIIIEHKNKSSNIGIEKRTFLIGDKIRYKVIGNTKSLKGKIIGFSDNKVIIKDKKGNISPVKTTELSQIQKQNIGDQIAKGFQITIALLGIVAYLGADLFFKDADATANSNKQTVGGLFFDITKATLFILGGLGLLIVTVFVAFFSGIIFLVRKILVPKFYLKNRWKLRILSLEKELK